MIRTGFILAFIIALFFIQSANAQDYKSALGVRLSSSNPEINNSISFKYFLGQKVAAEALLSFGNPVGLGLLLEKHNELGVSALKWFYGAGPFFGFGGQRNVGAQGVLGLDYKIPTIPFNLSIDWKPELSLAKEFSFEPAAIGLSARFTF